MIELKEISSNGVQAGKKIIREQIMSFEEALKAQDGALIGDNDMCPLKHSFADGIYVREIFIPKGMFVVGKIHKHKHPNFLLEGEVLIVTENGKEHLSAPMSIISEAGTKRALYTLTDTRWVTCHVNEKNATDIDELEDFIIAKNYREYERFRNGLNNKNVVQRFLSFLKKLKINKL